MCFHCVNYFCELLLNQSDKIDPVLADIFKLYDQHNLKFLTMNFALVWEPSLKRIIFKEFVFTKVKITDIKARLRYKYNTRSQLFTDDIKIHDLRIGSTF